MVSFVALPGGKQAVGEEDVNKRQRALLPWYKLRKDPQQAKPVVEDTKGPRFSQNPSFFILYLAIERFLLGCYFAAGILNLDRCQPSCII